MAAESMQDEPPKPGSNITVVVDSALPTVITVNYNVGSKTYRGALLDMSIMNGPHGIDVTKEAMEKSQDPEISSAALRHTYQLDPNAVDASLLPAPAKKHLTKPKNNRNVRNISLRPRKVLCSNCKQNLHSNPNIPPKNVVVTRSSAKAVEKKMEEKPKIEPTEPMNEPPEPGLDPPVSRKEKKTVPVLKLKLGNSKTGLNISKLSIQGGQENDDPEGTNTPEMSKAEYRRNKKEKKKAKMKAKLEKEGALMGDIDLDSVLADHKKKKYGKHKTKRKNKNKNKKLPDEESKLSEISEESSMEPQCELNDSQKKEEVFESKNISNAGEFTSRVNKQVKVIVEKLDMKKEQPKVESNDEMDVQSENVDQDRWDIEQVLNSRPEPQSPVAQSPASQSPVQSQSQPISPISDKGYFEASSSSYHVQVSDISDPEDDDDDDTLPPPRIGAYKQPSIMTTGVLGGNAASPSTYPSVYNATLPLLMKLQTRTLQRYCTSGNQVINLGDVVWGKVSGYPWWPGRILNITQTVKENQVVNSVAQVTWFASSTMSVVDCDGLYPFLEFFREKHIRKRQKRQKEYPYAIREATYAARMLAEGKATQEVLFYIQKEYFDRYNVYACSHSDSSVTSDSASSSGLDKENSLDSPTEMMVYEATTTLSQRGGDKPESLNEETEENTQD